MVRLFTSVPGARSTAMPVMRSHTRNRVFKRSSQLTLLIWLVVANAPGATPYESPVAQVQQSQIDELVSARLRAVSIPPAHLCSDAVFVRRVYLDVIGTLPSATEAQRFILDGNP